MMPSFKVMLGAVRWRLVLLTVLFLTALHLVFIDDTLRNTYNSAVQQHRAKLDPPLPRMPTSDFTPAPFADGDTDEYLAICVAVKDQHADLTEWLTHYYHHLNVRRFYLMDDGSTPPLSDMNYSSFVSPRAITHRHYIPAMHTRHMQHTVYDECIALFGKRHKWMAFFDADEFLEVRRANESIHSILRSLEADPSVGALAVNWKMHTSTGLLTRPDSARKAFTACIGNPDPEHPPNVGFDNEHIKSIVKTAAYVRPMNPHKFELAPGNRTVGEHGDTVARHAWRVPVTWDRLALHHYGSKSRAQFEEKIGRGNGMSDPKKWEWWDRVEALPTTPCLEMTTLRP